jgi:ABC-type cobalamin/Fe3+-siderophores transport system ATPase subunit
VLIRLKNYRCFTDENPAEFSVSRGITALVGANNSGKSAILRSFFEFRDLYQRLSGSGQLLNYLQQPQGFNFAGLADMSEVFHNRNNRDIRIEVEPDSPIGTVTRFTLHVARGTSSAQLTLSNSSGPISGNALIVSGDNLVHVVNDAHTDVAPIAPIQELFATLGNTSFLPAFRNAINIGSHDNYFDMRTGQAFVTMWRGLKTGNSKASNESIYRLTADIQKLFEFSDLDINASENGETLRLHIDDKSYALSEVGSGLAQFILALGNVASKNPAIVLLDEPELNLHPSLQLDFLTTVASYASWGCLFATHSIGLARSGADDVYAVRRVDRTHSTMAPLTGLTNLAEFVGELGFLGYREMGYDQILLVEGPTDVKTIQQFLRLFGKDHKVVLLSLGGGNSIHGRVGDQLSELLRLSDRIAVIIDSERSADDEGISSSRTDFVAICSQLGIVCHVLERRALENYLSEGAVRSVKGDSFRALAPYEARSALGSTVWGKQENWRIARRMTREDIESTDLGKFLARL